ncbi:MAG: methyl-accepting chemotaxis protein [Candidatus Thiodiazotropha sp. (ex Rostrolucina anterorostrata)]|nr:methyl-accepting chemotaxis protein [Candidatus Thiodiazotropha sp. (ex Rostrolucina anterorostrata)]
MQFLRKFKITHRLWLLIVLASIGIMAVTIASLFQTHTGLMAEKSVQTRHLVETAHSILSNFHALSEQGKMDVSTAKKSALQSISTLRYDESNYFWINDMHPKMVMHPIKPKLNGKDLSKFEDPSGKKLFVAFVDKVKAEGAGNVPYLWPKPGAEEPVPKISYVKGFKPWGWIIGSGIYVDDVDTIFWQNAAKLGMVVILILIPFLIISPLIGRSVCSPLQATINAMDNIAQGEGDLTQRMNTTGNDEIARLAEVFNLFIVKIQQTMAQVEDAGDQLSQSSNELVEITTEDNRNIEQQYKKTQQVATAVTAMSTTVREIAQSADGAAAAAQDAGAEAESGMRIMRQTTDVINTLAGEVENAGNVINELEQESKNIGSVLDVIRGIAEQTNLLALNAAIEAARAGEQGRGFAVVADEVRTLASRTKESTQEIQKMIERLQQGSNKAVGAMNKGSTAAKKTIETASAAADSITKIAQDIGTVSDMNAQIACAAEKQSTAAQEVDHGVVRIAALSELSTDGSRQVSSAADALSGLSDDLKGLIHTFKLS